MEKKPNKIVGLLFLIWFFGSMIAMIYFSNKNTYYSLMIFGQMFFVVGLMAVISTVKEYKETKRFDINRIFLLLFVIVGLGYMIIPFLILYQEKLNIHVSFEQLMPFIILSLFFFVGLIMITIYVYKRKKLTSSELITVNASVVGINKTYSDDGTLYAPILEYEFSGSKHKYESNSYSNFNVVNVGDIKEIKVNPLNPEEIYFKEGSDILVLIMGLLFTCIPIVIILLLT